MNPVSILKTVASIAVSSGAGAVVGNAVKLTTPVGTKTLQKITIAVGGFALSGLVAEAAANYTEREIDGAVAQIKELKKLIVKK